ncbi:aminoglycoside phosphotransferase family protein [Streptomyces erythrochromogenes]|uniref:aminoglycoside phosphotransferase family protein n=1 Tax=Streptomyces erythrochromogenes TaxID=285574 RepID=UPI00224FA565|nr:aminoglycoside phosphotransferase family protein [Streptomyces erythrochromogenes]MCX5585546.1 aminoglycoside phosphotransferase family protein [Streptomyces erythrochromogenes]
MERACAELAGAAPTETVRVRTGPKTAVYRVQLADGRRVVVKLFAADVSHSAADEARLLAVVAESGRVRVPAVIGHGPVPGLTVCALITSDAGSNTLRDAVRAGQMPLPAALLRLALLMAAFHTIEAPAGVRLAPGIGQQVSALATNCPRQLFVRLAPALEVIAGGARRERLVWCHGDLHLENVIRGADRRLIAGLSGEPHLPEYVVDFEAATVEAPEYDLAQTLVTCDALEPSDRVFMAAAYGRPVDTPLLDAYVAFQAVRGWTYAARREGRDRDAWAARLRLALPPQTERTVL